VKQDDPAIAESKRKLKQAEAMRKGRAASILTTPGSGLGDSEIERPEARAGATTLG
jgi:hypothetical protein